VPKIVIGGGSAGGNLALGLISSILHPHSGIPSLTLPSPLNGVFLISPWVSFSTDAKSIEENKENDMFPIASMVDWAGKYVTPEERNNYSEPVRAKAEWWKDAPVDSILMVCGDSEMFRDDTMVFAETLTEAGLNLEFVNCPLETHVECTLELGPGMEPSFMSKSVRGWFDAMF
jgi:acetyl esterase/lipase